MSVFGALIDIEMGRFWRLVCVPLEPRSWVRGLEGKAMVFPRIRRLDGRGELL